MENLTDVVHHSFSALTATIATHVHTILTGIRSSQDEIQKLQNGQTDLIAPMMEKLTGIKDTLGRIEEKQSELENKLKEMDTALDYIKENTDNMQITIDDIQRDVSEIEGYVTPR